MGLSTLRLIADSPPYLPQPRYLTDEGRLYFDSADSLVGADSNVGAEDVYQYEPQDLGNCAKQGGCVSLISGGRGPYDSNFLTTDPAGEDVFFTTRDHLVARDTDSLIDLYDARVGGGEAEAVPPVPCQGEGCQPLGPPAPEPVPASQS